MLKCAQAMHVGKDREAITLATYVCISARSCGRESITWIVVVKIIVVIWANVESGKGQQQQQQQPDYYVK